MPNTSSKATVSSKKPNPSNVQQKSSQNNQSVNNQSKNQPPSNKAKAGSEQSAKLHSKNSSIETKSTIPASQVNNKPGNQATPPRPVTSRRDRKQQRFLFDESFLDGERSSDEKEDETEQEESGIVDGESDKEIQNTETKLLKKNKRRGYKRIREQNLLHSTLQSQK